MKNNETEKNETPAPTFAGYAKEEVLAKLAVAREKLEIKGPGLSSIEYAQLMAATLVLLGNHERADKQAHMIGVVSFWDAFPKSASAMRQHLFDKKKPAEQAVALGKLADI